MLKIIDVARLCHEVNRGYCAALGDTSQLPWDEAPDWQKTSAINGVKFILANLDAPPSASHESWVKEKLADGWTRGDVKDPAKKEHPCMVPFVDLPVEQKAKDFIFGAIVRTVLDIDDIEIDPHADQQPQPEGEAFTKDEVEPFEDLVDGADESGAEQTGSGDREGQANEQS